MNITYIKMIKYDFTNDVPFWHIFQDICFTKLYYFLLKNYASFFSACASTVSPFALDDTSILSLLWFSVSWKSILVREHNPFVVLGSKGPPQKGRKHHPSRPCQAARDHHHAYPSISSIGDAWGTPWHLGPHPLCHASRTTVSRLDGIGRTQNNTRNVSPPGSCKNCREVSALIHNEQSLARF